jgi:hypothetical protein
MISHLVASHLLKALQLLLRQGVLGFHFLQLLLQLCDLLLGHILQALTNASSVLIDMAGLRIED